MLDEEVVPMRAGDFLVERGKNHGWVNRSGAPCRILCVLIDGRFDPEIAPRFAPRFAPHCAPHVAPHVAPHAAA